jgi:hypothetical protein
VNRKSLTLIQYVSTLGSVLPAILHDSWIGQVLLHGFKIIVIDEHERVWCVDLTHRHVP